MPAEQTMSEVVDGLSLQSLAKCQRAVFAADQDTGDSFDRLVERGLATAEVRPVVERRRFYRLTEAGRAAAALAAASGGESA